MQQALFVGTGTGLTPAMLERLQQAVHDALERIG
jgi:hypothetical protein